jgi:hypothetical protein
MSQKNVRAPRLPDPPAEYDAKYLNQLLGVLRLYFNQLDNGGPVSASTQRINGDVIAALSLVQPNPLSPGSSTVSVPTEADLPKLRAGDVYCDTTAGNVLKIKI